MTSRRPYWCPKTMKRRPCWCPKLILWELNSFLMQTLSFVPINLHRCWTREWKHSIPEEKWGLRSWIIVVYLQVYTRNNFLGKKTIFTDRALVNWFFFLWNWTFKLLSINHLSEEIRSLFAVKFVLKSTKRTNNCKPIIMIVKSDISFLRAFFNTLKTFPVNQSRSR